MKRLAACLFLLTLEALAQKNAGVSPPSSGDVSLPDGTRISVMLNTTLNAKKARVGDLVKLEVTRDVTTADGKVPIPAGSKLVGRVSVAMAFTKVNPESQLSIVVERAEWKKRRVVLNGFIVGSIRPPSTFDLMAVRIGGGQGSIAEGPSPPPSPYERLPGEQADPRHWALPDVELRVASDPSIGSVLVSRKKNVVLESGTTFVIRHTVLEKP